MKRSLFTLFSLIFLVAIFPIQKAMAISYSWVGNFSSEWENPQNWSPSSGYPDSADFVSISSGTYNLQLHQNRKVSNLTLSSKTIDLNGYSLTVYGTTTFTSGTVTGGTLYLRGNLAAFNGTTFGSAVEADCGYIRFSGSTFNSTVTATDNGVATGTGAGGCTFNGDVHIIHNGTGTYFTLANSTGDIFNANLRVTNNSDHEIYLSTSGVSQYKGNLVLESTSSGGVSCGNNGGTSTLDSAKTISIGTAGFSADVLTLKNFTQAGSTAQVLTLTGTAIVNIISSTFNGSLTVTSPGFLLKNSTFNGESSFTRNGTSNHQSDGGNTYNGNVTFSNNGSGGRLRLATTIADTYNANATFNSTGQDVQVAYLGENLFKGDITINSNKVVFNTSTGKVTFAGSNNQSLHGSYNFPFKKLAINKTSGTVTANTTLSVDDSLIFVKGNLITSSTSVLTMKLGSKAIGASSSSLVEGPVKKTGNTAFIYPLGKNSSYRPLEISAPSTTTSEFTGEYVEDSVLIHSVQRDSSLGFLIRNKYWKLNRISGTSQVYVTLSWDSLNALVDTFVNVASWNGSQWQNLGKSNVYGSKLNGSIKSTSVATSYSEFVIGYYSNEMLPNPLACDNVQDWLTLKGCLANIPTNGLVEITSDFSINNSGPVFFIAFPFEVQSGVTLQSGGTSTKWWEPNCHLISTNHEATYTNSTNINRRSLYLFALQGGATIQNLRIRGADCNFKDDNENTQLSGGIHVEIGTGIAVIRNCEISCFSHSGIWKDDAADQLDIENCFIHKVKGAQDLYGIGYGVWTQSLYTLTTPQKINFINTIFDDCKAAIDGQAKVISWDINKCTLTQFFSSEDINMHNDNRFGADCPCSSQFPPYYLKHWLYTNTANAKFYGNYWDNAIPCNASCTGGSTFTSIPGYNFGDLSVANLSFYNLSSNEIPIHDVGGAETSIKNTIFHKKWPLDKNGNINCNYPNLDPARYGSASNFVNISNNTFATDLFDKDVVLNSQENNAGYAKIGDNYIKADIWSSDGNHIISNDNSFSYQQGTVVASLAPQPHELSFDLTDGTNSLGTTYTLSPLQNHKFIQFVNVNTAFNLEATITNAGGSAESHYIIRPNPNTNGVTTTSESHVVSNENYFYEGEVIESGNAITHLITYDKPGLYGIDVMGFDAHDYGTTEKYDFRASSWQHIPVIVKGTQEQVLYFNIKDSYDQDGATTGVKKQAYLNKLLIWEEDISKGGTGFEYVAIDLAGLAVNGTTAIMDSIHTDGTENIVSFSIFMEDNISSSLVAGVSVWVDDIYIPKTGSANGDNLIKDGSCELQTAALCPSCYWFQNLSDFNTGCGNTDVAINSVDKKSGSQALYLMVPFSKSCLIYSAPVSSGQIVASIGTFIDFTDLLSCADYWDGTSSNVGFEEIDNYSFNGGSTYTYTNRKFVVDGDIEIKDTGTTLVFTGCQIVFKPNNPPFTIKVKSGAELKIECLIDPTDPLNVIKLATHIFACDDMWGGIINEAGGVIDIISGSSSQLPTKIEDADKAIQSDDGDVNIRFVNFNNNYIGIELKNYDKSPLISANDKGFLGIVFSCSDSILTKPLHAGELPFANFNLIDVDHVNIGGVGSPTAYRNKLHDAIYGIRANHSTAQILNTEFNNIGVREEICRLCEGAIFASDGSNLTIGGLLSVTTGNPLYRNYFKNSNVGIMTKGVNTILVQGNHFDEIGKGFIAHNAFASTITINENNEFYNVDNGIIAREITGNVTIEGNMFNPASLSTTDEFHYSSTAITLQNYNDYANTLNNVIVSGNTILDCRIGIHALNILNMSIGADVNGGIGNTITFSSEKGTFHCGIWIENCPSANIQSNEITKLSGGFLLEGIMVTESADALVNMNTITSADVPVHVFGNCSDTEFHCNYIDNQLEPGAGVVLDNAQLPDQGFDPVGAPPDGQTWDNQWHGYTGSNRGVTGVVNQPFIWYFDDSQIYYDPNPLPGTISADGLTSPDHFGCATMIANDNPNRDVRYGALVHDTLNFEHFSSEFIYKNKEQLYALIKSDTSILTRNTANDSVFTRFYNETMITNIALFDRVDSLILAGNLDPASDLNLSIADTNLIETNRKIVNDILINKVLMDVELSATDSTTLEEIALQNPLTDGKAVYQARAILFLEMHYFNEALRLSSQLNKNSIVTPKEPFSYFKLIPNPANEKCMVKFEEFNHNFVLQVRHATGQIVYSSELPPHTQYKMLDTSTLDPGMYFVHVNDGKAISEIKKLVMVR